MVSNGFFTRGPVNAFFVSAKLSFCGCAKLKGVPSTRSNLIASVSMLRLGRKVPRVLDRDRKERMSVRFCGSG